MRCVSTTELTTEIKTEFEASSFAKSTERDILNNEKENKREDHDRIFVHPPNTHWRYKAVQMEIIPLGLTPVTDKK